MCSLQSLMVCCVCVCNVVFALNLIAHAVSTSQIVYTVLCCVGLSGVIAASQTCIQSCSQVTMCYLLSLMVCWIVSVVAYVLTKLALAVLKLCNELEKTGVSKT